MKKICLCGDNFKSISKYKITADEINTFLSKHFEVSVKNLVKINYEILVCPNCELEFCSPFSPGDSDFYEWITKQPTYYPSFRWEYDKVLSLLKSNIDSEDLNLLDVGCGDGIFLSHLNNNISLDLQGIDTTESSVKRCKEKGLNVHKGYLEDVEGIHRFDIITSFHVLEHVPNPYGFIKEKLRLLKQDGTIYISTPLSPMSFEYKWFDILNHPPHHMTRWNTIAYTKMAKALNCQIKFHFPAKENILKQVFISILLDEYGKYIPKSKIKIGITVLKNLTNIYKSYRFQKRRILKNGTNSNTILVELKRK